MIERIHAVAAAYEETAQFYIPATTSVLERRPRTLKHDDTFGMFDNYGDIVPGHGIPEGLYHQDTRFLSEYRLFVNGVRPLLLGSTVQDNNAFISSDLTNPDFFVGDRLHVRRESIHIVRTKFLWHGRLHERVAVHNFDSRDQSIILTFIMAADFADLFEVRGHQRPRRGTLSATTPARDMLTYAYAGLDGSLRATVLQFSSIPAKLDRRGATFELELASGARTSLFVQAGCRVGTEEPPQRRNFFVCMREARKLMRQSACGAARVETSNAIFNEMVSRSTADLYMLTTETGEGRYPYAGIPWFSTAFGRDGIITAAEMLWVDPEIAKGVLKFLAATQAREFDPEADAEPGKILHELRQGEMANLGEIPFGRYYGSVDSTPLFVMLAGLYHDRTGDLVTIANLWGSIEAALRWIDDHGDRDGDGFVEYYRESPNGLANQGWKDSQDSIFHRDGRLADGPIALCEVQGYCYAAKLHGARLARALNLPERAAELERGAELLRRRFEDAFWCEDIGCYALALDGDKVPCGVRTSNAGQVLLSGIAAPDRAARVANHLMGRDFFSGWGIRTVASTEARYNPMSYHDGSIWPHDNAMIALGMARYGHHNHVERLFAGLFDAGSYMELRRLPELFCGFSRQAGKGPTSYPVACSPQAWAAAAPFALIQACLGLCFDHRASEIRFAHPRLPYFLDEMVIRSLSLGHSRMDVAIRRHGPDVTITVLNKEGDGQVIVTL